MTQLQRFLNGKISQHHKKLYKQRTGLKELVGRGGEQPGSDLAADDTHTAAGDGPCSASGASRPRRDAAATSQRSGWPPPPRANDGSSAQPRFASGTGALCQQQTGCGTEPYTLSSELCCTSCSWLLWMPIDTSLLAASRPDTARRHLE